MSPTGTGETSWRVFSQRSFAVKKNLDDGERYLSFDNNANRHFRANIEGVVADDGWDYRFK